ncbi:cysteine--tRNA ligase, partial [Odoribacter splanchnicus]
LMAAVRALDKVKASAGNTVDVDELITQCEEAIDDDLNTPVLISHLFDGVRMINSLVAGNEKIDAGNLAKLKKLYQDYVFDILGLKAESESVSQDHEVLGKILDMVMSIRTEAKQKKDWATSDKIRDELKAAGVAIKDTKEGYEWELVEN